MGFVVAIESLVRLLDEGFEFLARERRVIEGSIVIVVVVVVVVVVVGGLILASLLEIESDLLLKGICPFLRNIERVIVHMIQQELGMRV